MNPRREGIAKHLIDAKEAFRIYHNIRVQVWTGKIEISKLGYWRQNARTFLNFRRIEHETGRRIEEMTDDEILDHLLKDPDLKLRDLAKSIDKNGVRVPVTLTADGRLIDGNRRLFACKILVREYEDKREELPKHVIYIPVDVLPRRTRERDLEKLVIAEANFVSDLKVDWPREVKATVIEREFREARAQGRSREQAYARIRRIYGIDARDVDKFLEIAGFTDEFVDNVDKDRRIEAQAIVKDCWNCFEDFINKTKYGRGKLPKSKFEKLKEEFFKYVSSGRIKSMPRVRDLIDCYRDPTAWEMVQKSAGLRLREAATIARANLEIKSYSERIKQFRIWLESLSKTQLSEIGVKPLQELLNTIQRVTSKIGKSETDESD